MMDQTSLRSEILETVNAILILEGCPTPVSEVRIVAASEFFDQSYGTAMVLDDGSIALRIAVRRSPDQVADTILHETAHVLLGPEHIDAPDHGPEFQGVYQDLREKYLGVVTGVLEN